MPRTIAKVLAVVVAAAIAAVIGAYALLVIGCRDGIEYYYGR